MWLWQRIAGSLWLRLYHTLSLSHTLPTISFTLHTLTPRHPVHRTAWWRRRSAHAAAGAFASWSLAATCCYASAPTTVRQQRSGSRRWRRPACACCRTAARQRRLACRPAAPGAAAAAQAPAAAMRTSGCRTGAAVSTAWQGSSMAWRLTDATTLLPGAPACCWIAAPFFAVPATSAHAHCAPHVPAPPPHRMCTQVGGLLH